MKLEIIQYEDIRPGDVIRYSSTVHIDGTCSYADVRVLEVGRATCHAGHGSDRWYARVEAVNKESAEMTFTGVWSIAHCLTHPAARHGKLVIR